MSVGESVTEFSEDFLPTFLAPPRFSPHWRRTSFTAMMATPLVPFHAERVAVIASLKRDLNRVRMWYDLCE